MKLEFLALILWSIFPQNRNSKMQEEFRFVFDGKETQEIAIKEPLEFIENNEGQKYLDVITFKDRFILDLLKLNNELRMANFDTNPENRYACPRNLLENFSLRGYLTPNAVSIPPRFCGNMQQTCCLPNDFEDLETLWKQDYSPKIKYYQNYFKFYVKSTLSGHSHYLPIAERIAKNHKKDICVKAASRLLEIEMSDEIVQETLDLMDRFLDFDYKFKRGFVCLLCDYANVGELDFKDQIHGFNRDMCNNLVDHTFDFQYLMNRVVYRYINAVGMLAVCTKTIDNSFNDTVVESHNMDYLQIDNNQESEMCHTAKHNGLNIFVNCLKYCSDYNLWKPENPTYPDLDILARIHENVKNYLFEDQKALVVEAPKKIAIKWVVEPKYDKMDLFNNWEVEFVDKLGVKFGHFTDLHATDL